MVPVLNISIIGICCVIAYQDFSDREMHWILFPALALFLVTDAIIRVSVEVLLKESFQSLVFLTSQGFLLLTYYLLRGKPLGSIINKSIGFGDILVFLILIAGFTHLNFIVLYISGLTISLVIWLFVKLVYKPEVDTIPLAGMICLYTILILIAEIFNPHIDRFYNFL